MQDQRDSIEQADPFSGYLRQRLEEHRLPVEADGWKEIEVTMKRRTLHKRAWVAGLVAAAIFMGLVWFIAIDDNTHKPVEMAGQPTLVPSTQESAKAPQSAAIPVMPSEASPVVTQSLPRNKKEVSALPADEKETNRDSKTSEEINTPDPATAKEEPVITTTETKKEEKKQEVTVPTDNNSYRLPSANVGRKKTVNKKSSSWLIAAGGGSAGGSAIGQSTDKNSYNDPVFSDGTGHLGVYDPNYTTGSANNNDAYAHVNYRPAITFGLTVRKNLTARIAIESGLVYTYLRNDYEQHTIDHSDRSNYFHYLGVPLNLVVYLVDKQKWNIYLSGGIMADKCVSFAYTNTYFRNGSKQTLSGYSTINGLQWSLNGMVGISYRIQRQWSLYAEPRVSYYFDNNQPITSRTEHPVNLGIGAGLRFEF